MTINHCREIRHFHLFCGLGGGAAGFNRGQARVGSMQARFRCLGGIDCMRLVRTAEGQTAPSAEQFAERVRVTLSDPDLGQVTEARVSGLYRRSLQLVGVASQCCTTAWVSVWCRGSRWWSSELDSRYRPSCG